MKQYKVEGLIDYSKVTLDSEHIVKSSTQEIQQKLKEYARAGWRLVSTNATSFGLAATSICISNQSEGGSEDEACMTLEATDLKNEATKTTKATEGLSGCRPARAGGHDGGFVTPTHKQRWDSPAACVWSDESTSRASRGPDRPSPFSSLSSLLRF